MTATLLDRPTKTLARFRDAFSLNRRMMLPNNPWKLRASLGSNQSISSSGSNSVVHLDTITYDTANSWNAAGFYAVVPTTGFYVVTLNLSWNVPNGTTTSWLVGNAQVFQGAGAVISGNVVSGSGAGGAPGILTNTTYNVVVSDVLSFNAGDQIQAQCSQQNQAGGALSLIGASHQTYMTVHLISG